MSLLVKLTSLLTVVEGSFEIYVTLLLSVLTMLSLLTCSVGC